METAPTLLFLVPQGQDGPSLPPASLPPGGAAPQGGGPTQTSTGAPGGPDAGQAAKGNPLAPLFLPIAVFAIFMWLVVMRPEKKRQRQRQELLNSLQKGDHVVTSGGLHGQVVRLDGPTITLKVDDNLRLKFDRNAIARVTSSKERDEAS